MPSPFGPMLLIANPRAGKGAVKGTLPDLRRELDAQGLEHDVHLTTGPGDGEAAARAALRDGRRFLVAVGGDGTIQEVVNGMLAADGTALAEDAVFGVAQAGSGGDFPRTFGLDRDPARLAKHHLSGDATMAIDVGVATFRKPDGTAGRRYFANIAEVGWGADVVRRAARYPRWVGRPRYLIAAYAAVRAVKRQTCKVQLEKTSVTLPIVNLVVANCQFFGGGMKVAPRALPDDGVFNVQAFSGKRSQAFLLTPKIFRGEHLPHPEIAEWQSATVAVDPPQPEMVEADGELFGTTPATFSLLPQVLRLKI